MAKQLSLPDGRNLDYSILGAADGFPLIYIHGQPGSHIPPIGVDTGCEKKGLKCITFSRAGYGGSSRKKERRVVDVVDDIEALKKHLGIGECYVAGWSGGGPHALACAARLSGCRGALVIASPPPLDLYTADGFDFAEGQGEDNIEEFQASLKGEPALQEFCKAMRTELLGADAEGLVASMSTLLSEVDKKAVLFSPGLGQNLVDQFQEAYRISADGHVDDGIAFIEPWGFGLDEIKAPVYLWQGNEDKMVPFAHGEWLAKKLPKDKLSEHLLKDEGHISIIVGKMEEMLDELSSVKN